MKPDVIVVTERSNRGLDLAEAVRMVARSQIVTTSEAKYDIVAVKGLIVDASIDRARTRVWLQAFSKRIEGRSIPVIYLLRSKAVSELSAAERLGATACLSAMTEPSVVVAALFRQIAPQKTFTEIIVEHSIARAVTILNNMNVDATIGPVNLREVDELIDPVLQAMKDGGVFHWLKLIQNHDDMTLRHSLLVAGLIANLAVFLHLPRSDRTSLVRAALVHDVGKARIPLGILNKPGRLDDEEMQIMRTHASIGHEILLASGMTDNLGLSGTRHHHEMLDGSGYPDGLKGEEIGDVIRLLTICDIYAALTEDRPYRPAMPQEEAFKILRSMVPSKLESGLVEAFAASISADETLSRKLRLTLPILKNLHSTKSATP
ncbi:HD-GYP domain-containing protein [Methylobacterium sp. NPDC080182]|uniref:HD-GYP domain-containing protein n=1 Tax=Methylobacterium sp. NPDC080182 TaxID=3390590 RepID=UPI003D05194C